MGIKIAKLMFSSAVFGVRMLTKRAKETTPFRAMSVLERAQQMEDVVHLEVGEPDFEPPAEVIDSAIESMLNGNSGYTTSRGKIKLREAVSDYYQRTYDLDIGVDRIVITPGTSAALTMVCLALIEEGDEAILTDPYYACYPNFIRQTGGTINTVPLDISAGFAPDIKLFEESMSESTKVMLLNSPSNPTGSVLKNSEIEELAEIAQRNNTTIVSDEVYHGIYYDTETHSVLEHTDDAFVVDGFSKRFAMTGWRLGWIVCPPECIDAVNRLTQNLVICATNFVQDAGIAALQMSDDLVPKMREVYRKRRDVLIEGVEKLGVGMGYVPEGAYYLLIDVSELGDAFDISNRLLDEVGVATTPGPDFGGSVENCLRLSYATGMEDLKVAVERIGKFIEDNQ